MGTTILINQKIEPINTQQQFEQAKEKLKMMVKNHSVACLDGYTMLSSTEKPVTVKKIPIYSYWLSLVLLSTDQMQIIVKTHFNFKTLEQLLKKAFKKNDFQVSFTFAQGYINEFSNLLGTKVKNSLNDNGILTGMSLPMMTRGFDNYFFEEYFKTYRENPDQSQNYDHFHFSEIWGLEVLEADFYVSMEVDVLSAELFERLSTIDFTADEKEQESSVLEFL